MGIILSINRQSLAFIKQPLFTEGGRRKEKNWMSKKEKGTRKGRKVATKEGRKDGRKEERVEEILLI